MKTKIAALCAVLLLLLGCGKDGDSLPRPRNVRFQQERYEILLNYVQSPKLLMTVGDGETEYDWTTDRYGVKLRVEDPRIASVAEDTRRITGLKYGITKLVAESAYWEAPVTAEIVVYPLGLRLGKTNYALEYGETVAVELFVTERGQEIATTNRFDIVWRTEDERVATVDAEGRITAVGYGATRLVGKTPLLSEELAADIVVELHDLRFEAESYTLDEGETVTPRLLTTRGGVQVVIEDPAVLDPVWEISDSGVATVTSEGCVMALTGGAAKLTLRTPHYPQAIETLIAVRSPWTGEWMLSLWNGDAGLAGRIYMELRADGRFVLYQSLDVMGFAVFRGTYTVATQNGRQVLNGVYEDGTPWKERYALLCEGDRMTLTSQSDAIVSQYVRTTIPDYVKDGLTAAPGFGAARKAEPFL